MNYKVGKIINNDVIDTILHNRNIDYDKVDEILDSNSKNYESEDNYKNIDRAYECLMDCIKNNNEISVIPDTDVDGFCSSAILYTFIYHYLEYDNIHYIIRKDNPKSHGLDEEVMKRVLNDGTQLLITPDAGSNDFEQQKILHENGIKFIALDHHEFDRDNVPSYSIVVNNQDGQVKNTDGSGTLVTYKFIRYVAKKEGIDLGTDFMDLVNISNIADMTDMTSLENRYFYNRGKRIKNMHSTLLLSFVSKLKRKKYITIENVAFGISNKINSIIRVGSYQDKCDLFEALINSPRTVQYKWQGKVRTQSLQEAVIRIADRLKKKQKADEEKAMESLKIINSLDDKVLLVDGSNIPSKISGLVANKIINKYHRPTLVLKPRKDKYFGSARGYMTKSFKDICEESELFDWVQGHSNAYGFSMNKNNLEDFVKYCNKALADIEFVNEILVDYVYDENIPIEDLNDIGDLEELWCSTIKEPNLVIKNVIINTQDIDKKGGTFSFKIGGIYYRKDYCSKEFFNKVIDIGNNEEMDKDLKMDILCNVKTFEFNGRNYVNIIDVESEAI